MVSKIAVRWLKLIFIISTTTFIIIQIQLRRGASSSGDLSTHTKPQLPFPNADTNDKSFDDVDISKSKITIPSIGAMPGVEDIRRSIEDNNAHAQVYNEDKYGPVESIDYVIIVQAHNRSKYLEKLIQSLSNARDIDKALLIFSHDYFSPTLNDLVRSVKFCRTMQIFYPYNMQIYPDRFPGQDPKDCPGDIGREAAEQMKCQNYRTPDKYGHYRVAKFSQVKHHWWWKMNYVFDGISRLRNYTGWVLRLEEDHYVSPDFLHTFDYIVKNKESLCSECSVITLGFYLKHYLSYSASMNKLAVYPWFSSRHNMGMAMNRNTWEQIRSCANLFCKYDDYNWDWSLQHVNLKCLKAPMMVIYAKSPRVFHIGDCGIHHVGKQCTADTSASKVMELLRGVKNQLFPMRLEVSERSKRTLKAPKENGGWADIRDHELCQNHSRIHLENDIRNKR